MLRISETFDGDGGARGGVTMTINLGCIYAEHQTWSRMMPASTMASSVLRIILDRSGFTVWSVRYLSLAGRGNLNTANHKRTGSSMGA